MTALLAAVTYDPDDVKPGWIALVLVILLAVATFLLWRSMNTQLRRIQAPTQAELRSTGRDAASSRDGGAVSSPDGGPAEEPVDGATPADLEEPRDGPQRL